MIHTITSETIYFNKEDLEIHKEDKLKTGLPKTDSLGRVNSALSQGFVENFAKNYYQSLGYFTLNVGEYLVRTQFRYGNPDRIYRKKFDTKTKSFKSICSKLKSKSRIENRIKSDNILKELGLEINRKKLIWRYPYDMHKNNILIKILGKEKFELICDCNASFLGSHPDLFVFNNKEHFFVEVKSAKDKLYCNQLVFISFVKYIFSICDCKILKVLPEGSKILTKIYKWNFKELFYLEQFNTFPCWRYSNNGTY